ncbi:uncharacterized protein IUM83_08718 [Phytophthora cinnamomi]|uniref:uncharacterized protein n=1 Tax=Phytophthora cinnamomi TaxID=4785 RepID=UPI003559F37F|nr:hypothetical protein IUM83_08718 [Phytophthora cinnamomi]
MNFFLITNPHSRLATQSALRRNDSSFGSRSFPLKPRRIGPKRPRNLPLKSKNCANAKKAEINGNNRRHRLEREVKLAAAELQEQIRQLDRRLTLMNERTVLMRLRSQDAALNTLNEYFRHIKAGINPVKHPTEAQGTKNFLLSTFATDLNSPDYTGLDHFIEQWQLLSAYHADIECRLARMEVNPFENGDQGQEEAERYVNVVKTYGTTALQISRTTIERIFPHILNDEDLVQWLIGKTYSFSFTFFCIRGRENRPRVPD